MIPTDTPTPEPTLPPTATRPALVIPTLVPEATSFEDWSVLFKYDKEAPLDVQEKGSENRDGIMVADITYASPVKGTVSAFLVSPPGEGPFAGAAFFHWYEPGAATSSRNEFLEEAVELAKLGTVSILIQGSLPWSHSPSSSDYVRDRSLVIEDVLNLERAVDVLVAQQNVDPQRIAVIGHDFGAMYASVLAGIDKRPSAYVLMAGTGRFADWFLKYWPSSSRNGDEYRAGMAPVDPINYLPHAAPAALYFQFASHDAYVSEKGGQEQFDAASEPKTIKFYDAEHELNEFAQRDRINWLVNQLGLAEAP
jgi:pimeloyl-ACP methyl ester carboxylesterase